LPEFACNSANNNQEAATMAHQALQENSVEDHKTLRRLGAVIGIFCLAIATMAVVIGVIMG
jgi:hypothetical protein